MDFRKYSIMPPPALFCVSDLSFHDEDKVRKKAKIRNRYNQVPRHTKDTTWESDKTQDNIIYNRAKRLALSQQVTTGLQITDMTDRNINNKNDPQKKHCLGTVKHIFTGGLN